MLCHGQMALLSEIGSLTDLILLIVLLQKIVSHS